MYYTLITGASSGIGAALARVFASHGHHVVLTGRDAHALQKVVTSIQSQYEVRVVSYCCDLLDQDAPDALLSWMAAEQIVLDQLVNNAGCGLVGAFATLPCTEQLQMIQLNVGVLVTLTHRLLPMLMQAPSARILQISSLGAFLPGPFTAVYYATKAFVHTFTQAIRLELRETTVSITECCPGPVPTQFGRRAGFQLGDGYRFLSVSADQVAIEAYRAMQHQKAIVRPGLWIKGASWILPWLPQKWLAGLMHSVLHKRCQSDV